MSKNEINVWYYTMGSQNNFGDYLGYYIPHKISGKKVNLVKIQSSKHKYVTVGSVLNQSIGINSNCTVWGSGIMTVHDKIPKDVKLLAVRGPVTQKRLLEIGITPPDVVGDPALILKKIYNPKVEKQYKLGIIPHYVDYKVVKENIKDPQINVINLLTQDIEGTIDQIASCEYTVSSSLHGVIVSHAYGVPSLWVKFSEKLFGNDAEMGDNVKFRDYFSSVGIDPYGGFDFKNKKIILSEVVELIKKHDEINHIKEFDVDKLFNSCPFKQNIIIDKKVNLIQEVRLIHALSESNFNIYIDREEEQKFVGLNKLNINYKIRENEKGILFSEIVKVNHAIPETEIGNAKKPIVFPRVIVNYLKSKWANKRKYKYSFTGLLTNKRKIVIEDWISKQFNLESNINIDQEYSLMIGDLFLSSSKKGREFPIKSWDVDYYRDLLDSDFVLCPSGDFVWSYRFFEAILCGAIPVVEESCPAYEGFKFYSMSDEMKDTVYSLEFAEHNFRLCLDRITIDSSILNSELYNLLEKQDSNEWSLKKFLKNLKINIFGK